MREATAAMLQVEAGRKMLMEEENELRSSVGRVSDGHASLKRQEASLQELDASQADARAEIEAERAELGGEFAAASGLRKTLSADVECGVAAEVRPDSQPPSLAGALCARQRSLQLLRHGGAGSAAVDDGDDGNHRGL